MCGRCGEDADKFFSIKPRRRKGDRKTGELADRCGACSSASLCYAPVTGRRENWQGTPSVYCQCDEHDAGYGPPPPSLSLTHTHAHTHTHTHTRARARPTGARPAADAAALVHQHLDHVVSNMCCVVPQNAVCRASRQELLRLQRECTRCIQFVRKRKSA
jgi:hypothetical protein